MPLKSYLRNKLVWISAILIALIFKASSGYFSDSVKTFTEFKARNYAEGLIAYTLEDQLLDKISNSNFLIEKYNSDGYISYAYIDSYKINDIRNSAVLYMDKAIDKLNEHVDFEVIEIPFGYIFGTKYFLANGVRVPIYIEALANQDVEVKMDTISKGINTTIIEIYLDISIDIQVVIPFQSNVITTNTIIPLSMEIINNEIPYYLGDFLS